MAKDDYFYIVYQVLKYLYDCLKTGSTPDIELLSYEYLNINEKYWLYIFESLADYQFIKGLKIIDTKDGKILTNVKDLMITPLGIQYLFENSLIQKIKNTLRDIKDITPMI